jgi:hypothetical protein
MLGGLIDHHLSVDDYERMTTPLVASGFHSAGAFMLDAIFRHSGRDAVLAVLRDPRRLPTAYDATRPLRPFDAALAQRLATLGNPPSSGRPSTVRSPIQ